MMTGAWLLFLVFCPLGAPADCSIHVGRFPSEAACHIARHDLARAREPDGARSIRTMVCTLEILS